jgi:hypothetical protein
MGLPWLATAACALALATPAGEDPGAAPGDPAATAQAPPASAAFVAGVRLGLAIPWGSAAPGLGYGTYGPLMTSVGLDLGVRPTPWSWLAIVGDIAFGCEDSAFAEECPDGAQRLFRGGVEGAVRVLRLAGSRREIWLGGGVRAVSLEIEAPGEPAPERTLTGVEVTFPRIEYGTAIAGFRGALGVELTLGRFDRESVGQGTRSLTGAERTLHGAAMLYVRGAFEAALSDEALAPVPPRGAGFLLSVGLGVGLPVASPGFGAAVTFPIALAAGYRFGPRAHAGLLFEVSPGVAGGCAPAAACEAFVGTLGVEGALRLRPTSPRDPWVGLAAGIETLITERLEGGAAVTEDWEGVLLRLAGGVQLLRTASLELGPYLALDVGLWTRHGVEANGVEGTGPMGNRVHGAATVGLRFAWLP